MMLISALIISLNFVVMVYGSGLLLLYRPKDITNECAFSRHLRFDISFGMGMSDTITLVFRTLNDIDYECLVEIVCSTSQYLLVVVRYPTSIAKNCAVNRDAFTVLKRWRCTRLCDLFDGEVYSPYFIFSVKDRIRFLFKSNSSINIDMYANLYQVTVTSARKFPKRGCNRRNETVCTVDQQNYCFTTGVVCDGIKNCGVDDWFDERKSQCTLPVERLGYAPVIAVIAAMLCAFVACGHALMRFLPPHANSFFIFNENEDNRLCIDPLLVPHGNAPDLETFQRLSIIPILESISSSETNTKTEESQTTVEKEQNLYNLETNDRNKETISVPEPPSSPTEEKIKSTRKNTIRVMTERLRSKLLSVRDAVSGGTSRQSGKPLDA